MKLSTAIVILFLVTGINSFSQESSFSKEIEAKIAKNRNEGLAVFEGIQAVFTIKLEGIKEPEDKKRFDLAMVEESNGAVYSCATNSNETPEVVLVVKGSMGISDLKKIIYSQAKIVCPKNSVEILDYQHEYKLTQH